MINIESKCDCSGCSMCANICPVNAIEMVYDNEGFLYPNVSIHKCIHCGLCSDRCPITNIFAAERLRQPTVYAAWSKSEETRINSTTGGIFSEFASYVYAKKGYVSGAVFTPEWTVKHIVSDNKDDLYMLRGSKYLQSDMNTVYQQIKKLLSADELVLICGTPCEISGLFCFLGKDYQNLIAIDLICRGSNSTKVFLNYLNYLEAKYKSKVKHVHFKNKTQYGWHRFTTKIEFTNGRVYNKDRFRDKYMRCYLNENCSIRPSCHKCRFKSVHGYGDITIADFWGIEKFHPELDDDKGTSLIKINTKKGEKFFQNANSGIHFRQCKLKEANTSSNSCFETSVLMGENREQFFEDMDKIPFHQLSRKYIPNPSIKSMIINHVKKAKKFLKCIISSVFG